MKRLATGFRTKLFDIFRIMFNLPLDLSRLILNEWVAVFKVFPMLDMASSPSVRKAYLAMTADLLMKPPRPPVIVHTLAFLDWLRSRNATLWSAELRISELRDLQQGAIRLHRVTVSGPSVPGPTSCFAFNSVEDLQTISTSQVDYSDDLCTLLAACSADLSHLTLSHLLPAHLQTLPRLPSLALRELVFMDCPALPCALFGAFFECCPRLTSLQLRLTAISSPALQMLSTSCQCLETLKLILIDFEDMGEVLAVCKSNPNLTSLDLSIDGIDWDEVSRTVDANKIKELGKMLPRLRVLRMQLPISDLSYFSHLRHSCTDLKEMVTQPFKLSPNDWYQSVQRGMLFSTGDRYDPVDFIQLFEGLGGLPELTVHVGQGSRVGFQDLRCLLGSLSAEHLIGLNIALTLDVVDGDMLPLLTKFGQLEELAFPHCAGLRAASWEAAANLSALRRLLIVNNQSITDAMVERIMSCCHHLQRLSLEHCRQISDQTLVNAHALCSSLRVLLLMGTSVTVQGVLDVVVGYRDWPLEHLHVGYALKEQVVDRLSAVSLTAFIKWTFKIF